MRITVDTTVHNPDTLELAIHQRIKVGDLVDLAFEYTTQEWALERILRISEIGVRQALIQLGWTPPPDPSKPQKPPLGTQSPVRYRCPSCGMGASDAAFCSVDGARMEPVPVEPLA